MTQQTIFTVNVKGSTLLQRMALPSATCPGLTRPRHHGLWFARGALDSLLEPHHHAQGACLSCGSSPKMCLLSLPVVLPWTSTSSSISLFRSSHCKGLSSRSRTCMHCFFGHGKEVHVAGCLQVAEPQWRYPTGLQRLLGSGPPMSHCLRLPCAFFHERMTCRSSLSHASACRALASSSIAGKNGCP